MAAHRRLGRLAERKHDTDEDNMIVVRKRLLTNTDDDDSLRLEQIPGSILIEERGI